MTGKWKEMYIVADVMKCLSYWVDTQWTSLAEANEKLKEQRKENNKYPRSRKMSKN